MKVAELTRQIVVPSSFVLCIVAPLVLIGGWSCSAHYETEPEAPAGLERGGEGMDTDASGRSTPESNTDAGDLSDSGDTSDSTDSDSQPDTASQDSTESESKTPELVCDATTHHGEGTYYSADGSGNCSFEPSPSDLGVAAMNHADYEGSAACGRCVRVDGPRGSITVRIVDRCPECSPGDLDLSQSAFTHIANIAAGRVPITWQYAPCEVEGPVRYYFKPGSNSWWTAVQVRNHRHGIAKLEYSRDGQQFSALERLEYNFFLAVSGMGPGPYAFRITDVYGSTLIDTRVPFQEGHEVEGHEQLAECR